MRSRIQFDFVIDQLKSRLGRECSILIHPLPYGRQILVSEHDREAGGDLYFSKKKGFSFVPHRGGNIDLANNLRLQIQKIIQQEPREKEARKNGEINHSHSSWIGTDEAGKGDIFGPLTIGGFLADHDTVEILSDMGIKDSKLLSPGGIKELADELTNRFADRISLMVFQPSEYNQIYPEFKPKGGISGILGLGHARAIKELAKRFPETDGAIIDQFGKKERVTDHLEKSVRLKLEFHHRAESDLAVAAAAIVARNEFDNALKKMANNLGFIPHAGSSQAAVNDLHRLHKRLPKHLPDYVKMHFSPVKKLVNRIV